MAIVAGKEDFCGWANEAITRQLWCECGPPVHSQRYSSCTCGVDDQALLAPRYSQGARLKYLMKRTVVIVRCYGIRCFPYDRPRWLNVSCTLLHPVFEVVPFAPDTGIHDPVSARFKTVVSLPMSSPSPGEVPCCCGVWSGMSWPSPGEVPCCCGVWSGMSWLSPGEVPCCCGVWSGMSWPLARFLVVVVCGQG